MEKYLMAIEILTKAIPKPPRTIIYGPEGVGKTTFGVSYPKPFLICSEGGADQFDVQRVNMKSFDDLADIWDHLRNNMDSFTSIVIDSLDWLEELCGQMICKKFDKATLDEFGFGGGPIKVEAEMRTVLSWLDWFRDQGKLVLLIAHSKVVNHQDPDLSEPYNRYELKCSKRTIPMFKEWCDNLFFVNYHRDVLNKQATGTGERLIWANRTPSMDAKNRYNIPNKTKLDTQTIFNYFKTNNKGE